MRIAIVGTGYVGLVTGTCLAELGHEVTCVDTDAAKILGLKQGVMPIYEPGLAELVAANAAAGRLAFTTELGQAMAGSGAIFIAVGTPARASDGQADLGFVHAAARQIAANATGFALVVTKSTVPVGTGDTIERIIATARPDADLVVVSNPEFLREGTAIADFLKPDRIVVGTEDARARAVMAEIYRPFEDICPVLMTGRRTAELIKYAANAFLATKITFINEMANLCEGVGADIGSVAIGMGLDHRIGRSFLNAGPGYGGSCFPKDTVALLRTAQDHGVTLRLVEDTIAVNDARKRAMARRVVSAAGGTVAGRTIAVLGLTFKPDTDDMREAPSVALIETLQRQGATIRAYDPAGMENAARMLDDVAFLNDPYTCVKDADAVVLMTEWAELTRLDLDRLGSRMRRPVFIDLRNVYAPALLERHGFAHAGIGHPPTATPWTRRGPDRRAALLRTRPDGTERRTGDRRHRAQEAPLPA
ncbi:UDP-glucose/GDP-mannose dehydrogenase family protein [Arsenicitalea aurantiaca]|uniref:UDP-glucose 6-dehydrogenase n=1 Tax=Arsenicitalea aurantiaca TaxID=1783274 RepID=A0A433XL65_9HYPH|nr:UDP-glucose/GDP-mannose dehydrogenase family protein [Arsenicitalea aurantiaca]RUT34820.1 UDP-glucose/GDP-mannose dehydrogenase family protein [Arsenicitalea aurantiaca]